MQMPSRMLAVLWGDRFDNDQPPAAAGTGQREDAAGCICFPGTVIMRVTLM